MLPFTILSIWLLGLMSLAVPILAVYLLWKWYEASRVLEWVGTERVLNFEWDVGLNFPTFALILGSLLLLMSVAGRFIMPFLLGRLARPADDPAQSATGAHSTRMRVQTPDDAQINVESSGMHSALTIVLVHGWGMNSSIWKYARSKLEKEYRVVTLDLAGLGHSSEPGNHDYRLANLASHLNTVLDAVGGERFLLVGHSIGGMITQTFFAAFPESFTRKIAGIVLAHTTYINPVHTCQRRKLAAALQKAVIEPLLKFTIVVSPFVRVMQKLSYQNGLSHLSNARSSFAGGQTREQLDTVSKLGTHGSPKVLARGALAMLELDVGPVLPQLPVPTLVVGGDKDTSTCLDASQYISQRIPRATLRVLKPAKHMGLIEHHEEFSQSVLSFARTLNVPQQGKTLTLM
ncbi:MAG TPA: alpha/beta hydrolase [Oligoflexus sp.]|uniref:alpha/beta fold hydrolase n=1 Tax=Oligoflexus sp. TaxID=1971216 RepID=UPI002D519D14|nr:alpha/beta hydrolase [Oligoflexus sp.]HYX36316.1 alpha/beta hydrolase [Oligoflexus sp.]